MTSPKAINAVINRITSIFSSIDRVARAVINGIIRAFIPIIAPFDRLLRRFFPMFNTADLFFSRILPYIIILAVAAFIGVFYIGGKGVGIQTILEGIGIVAGLVGAFFIYQSLNQEKNLQFMEGERLQLESKGPKTFAVLVSVGGRDLPFEPVKAAIYLTNIGIIVEKTNSGVATLFIPLDRVTEIGQRDSGIRIRSIDFKRQYVEMLIFVEDREQWLAALNQAMITRLSRPDI